MRHAPKAIAAIVIVVSASPVAIACLWDHDTLAMERRQFPGALELITGKFLRHSQAFYEWRVRDREGRLRNDPSPELYDDLAVAYEKLGDHEKAIAITLEKEERFPGRYETHANLGTFYIHAGQLERGIEQIERAIAIHPDAHFGREVYQKLLVEYVLAKRAKAQSDSPPGFPDYVGPFGNRGFAKFVLIEPCFSNELVFGRCV